SAVVRWGAGHSCCSKNSKPRRDISIVWSSGATRAGKRLVASLFLGHGSFKARSLPSKRKDAAMALDDKTRTELEAAAFRRLLEHLRARTDVQNIDLLNLAGFCRNCLSNWMKDAADARGVPMSNDESRERIYGMPYEEWKR